MIRKPLPSPVKRILKLLYKYSNRFSRNIIIKVVIKYENGECWSECLREIYEEQHGIQVGIGSYGCFNYNSFPKGTIFGNYCSVAHGVHFFGANHPLNFASTHPLFYNPSIGFVKNEKIERSVTWVGHDVWIGYNSIILPRCRKIETGAVIAAGSVVTKDIEPYTINAGVPARVIGKRFEDSVTQNLLASEWYLLPPEAIVNVVDDVQNIDYFIERAKRLRSTIISEGITGG